MTNTDNTSAARHTPTPWRCNNKVGYVFGPDCVVAQCGNFNDPELTRFNGERWNADARRIILCVNTHDELLAALKSTTDELADADPHRRAAIRFAREIITKAEGLSHLDPEGALK